ncbi:MAG: type II toxin-antitoxin system RelE family toxin [Candidatus Odinarchaeia archaeon]
MKYEILFSKQAVNLIKSLEKGYKIKLREVFATLGNNPFDYPYKKIKGEASLYRIRIGKYRILYEVDSNHKLIKIIKIDKRKTVYK